MKALFSPRLTLLLIASLMLVASCVAPLAASPQCAMIAQVMAGLAGKYGEATRLQGIMPNGQVLAIIANPAGSTWTALVVRPDGLACLMSSGNSWAEGDMLGPPAGTEG